MTYTYNITSKWTSAQTPNTFEKTGNSIIYLKTFQ